MEKSFYQLKKQELECFSQLLEVSKNYINKTDPYRLESLREFLYLRDQAIETLKSLKAEQKRINENSKIGDQDCFYSEISKIARSLVAIDTEILNILQVKKMKTIKEMTNIADNYSRNRKNRLFREEEHKRIDIFQR